MSGHGAPGASTAEALRGVHRRRGDADAEDFGAREDERQPRSSTSATGATFAQLIGGTSPEGARARRGARADSAATPPPSADAATAARTTSDAVRERFSTRYGGAFDASDTAMKMVQPRATMLTRMSGRAGGLGAPVEPVAAAAPPPVVVEGVAVAAEVAVDVPVVPGAAPVVVVVVEKRCGSDA